MKRHFLVAGVSALCMAFAPAMAFGTEQSPPVPPVGQTNSAPASATAGNANTSGQLIGQSGGGSQSADQTAVNTQVVPIALAPATSVQTLPVNLNLPVRIASPGENGDVSQSNSAPATAEATNVNASRQLITQSGGGGDKKKDGGSGQTARQTAVNTQVVPIAVAPATSVQTLPINANLPIRVLSPGRDGSVKQSNRAPATADATNLNGSKQAILQGPGKKGNGWTGGGGSQSAHQKAFNTQLLPIGLAPATSLQTLPVNVNAPIRFLDELPRLPVDPFGLLASPTDALGALPLGAVTGLLGGLPLGAVTGLLPALPVDGLI
jgi:hypothetical protein